MIYMFSNNLYYINTYALACLQSFLDICGVRSTLYLLWLYLLANPFVQPQYSICLSSVNDYLTKTNFSSNFEFKQYSILFEYFSDITSVSLTNWCRQLPNGVIRGQERLMAVVMAKMSSIQAYCSPNGNSHIMVFLSETDSALDL